MSNYNGFIRWGEHFRYILQPGDATRYEFALTFLDNENEIDLPRIEAIEDFLESEGGVDLLPWIISGVERGQYVTLTLYAPSQGGYDVSIESLRQVEEVPPFIDYLGSHLSRDVDRYTLAAICLASSVLVVDPFNVDLAASKMLKAPQLLAQLEGE